MLKRMFCKSSFPSKTIDDRHEIIGIEGSAANQSAVNIGLAKKVSCIVRFYAAAIEDSGILGSLAAVFFLDQFPDILVHGLRLFGSGGLPGADSPNRFVGNDDFCESFFVQMKKPFDQLIGDKIHMDTGFADAKRFSTAKDRQKPFGNGMFRLFGQHFIGFLKMLSAL